MRQRGFVVPPQLIIGLVVAGLVAIAVVVVRGWILDYGAEQLRAGETQERAKWQARANKELADAQAEIERLRKEKDAAAALHLDALAKAGTDYQRSLLKNDREKADFIAGVRAGRIVLRDPGRTAAACPQAGGSEGAAAPSTVAGGDAKTGSELSGQASEFLWGEASRADEIVEQLELVKKEYWSLYETCRKR